MGNTLRKSHQFGNTFVYKVSIWIYLCMDNSSCTHVYNYAYRWALLSECVYYTKSQELEQICIYIWTFSNSRMETGVALLRQRLLLYPATWFERRLSECFVRTCQEYYFEDIISRGKSWESQVIMRNFYRVFIDCQNRWLLPSLLRVDLK